MNKLLLALFGFFYVIRSYNWIYIGYTEQYDPAYAAYYANAAMSRSIGIQYHTKANDSVLGYHYKRFSTFKVK